MPRSKQFSFDSALAKATQKFCSHGYHATSIQNFVDCMGIGRGSIYDTFDSKRGLFLKALRLSFNSVKQRLDALLLSSSSPVDAILDVFTCAIHEQPRAGSFIVNAAVELAPFDPHIAELTFLRLIVQGQDSGHIPQTVDAPLTARCLLSLHISLGVPIRATPDETLLQQTRRQAQALLDCSRPS